MHQTETVFFSAEDFLQDMHQAILSAKHYVDIEMFIVEKDELSQKIINCLNFIRSLLKKQSTY